jgi:cytochrome c peroxidase
MKTQAGVRAACLFTLVAAISLFIFGRLGDAGGETLAQSSAALQLPRGLSRSGLVIPPDNPMTAEKVELGRLLFFDRRLSVDDTVACATCHAPEHGFTDGRKTSVGVGGQVTARNSPTIINRAFSAAQFWDGRARSLEEQVKLPLVSPVEMGMPSHEVMIEKLRRIAGYQPLFQRAFGTAEINLDRVSQAIAAFERTALSGNSPFDKFQAGDHAAMSETAQRGYALFRDKARCEKCHIGFNFTDEKYHNLGVSWDARSKKFKDEGRFAVTKNKEDRGAFKTPSLRGALTQTAPYMHDGSQATLEDVIEFYNKGGEKNLYLDQHIKPLKLTAQEKAELIEFLKALTGEGWQQITAPERFPQ